MFTLNNQNKFESFNIEVLATTDWATDALDHHSVILSSGWSGRVIPTFRPDAVLNPIRRDYAASMGLGRMVTADLIGEKAKGKEKRVVEEKLYHLFLDDPSSVGGRRQRWAGGILVADSEKD